MSRTHIVFFLCFLALSVLASFLFAGALWGVSAWAALSPFVGLACAAAVVPWLFTEKRFDPFRRDAPVRSEALRLLAAALCAIAVLSLLRSRQLLWGDRVFLRETLDQGIVRPVAPLASLVRYALYRFMNGIFLRGPDAALTIAGVAAGALSVLCAIRAAGLLAGDAEDGAIRRLAAAALISNGFAALFFGDGGAVAIALPATIAFLAAGLRFARGTGTLAIPALLLAVAVLSHASNLYLVPAFLYLFVLGVTTRGKRANSLVALGLALACWIAAELLLPPLAGSPGPAVGLAGAAREAIGRWKAGGTATLADTANALLVIGPASALALVLLATGRKRRTPERPGNAAPDDHTFLAIGAVSALALIAAGAGLVDGGIGWYAIATAGPALSLYAIRALKERCPERERFSRSLAILFLVGSFHTLPLVLVDAIPRAAEKRLLAFPLAAGRAETIIGDAALERDDRDLARAWYLASLAKNKSNPVAEFRLGKIAMQREEYPEAITHFLNAHELVPQSPRYRFELADALIAKLWYPEAIAHLETLTVSYPDSVLFWRRLGYARNNGNRYEPAIAAYERAVALEPGSEEGVRSLVSALLNRGAELQGEKRFEEARGLYLRVLSLYPREWRAFNNLAVIEMRLGRYREAYDILENALVLHTYESSLNFNMGIVLEKLGRYREALEHMRMARDTNPIYSEAPLHIERLERKLGLPSSAAQVDSQRSPLKMP